MKGTHVFIMKKVAHMGNLQIFHYFLKRAVTNEQTN